jgi:hypothetical protein
MEALHRVPWGQWRQVGIVERKALAVGVIDIAKSIPHCFQFSTKLEAGCENVNVVTMGRRCSEYHLVAPSYALW